MSGNRDCTVYVGNLDERVSERVLYDILIQAGRVVDLHVPKDRETDKPKGYAFAEYESEEIANYAVKLFSGLVTLYNRTLKFAISGQDKASANNGLAAATCQNQSYRTNNNGTETGDNPGGLSGSYRFSAYSSGSRSNGNGYEYGRRVVGGTLDGINLNRSRRYDSSNPVPYSSSH
ncbi:hypothetical protein MLD38_001190 [Melastoma candidum]|uniref:Uncharacterized protein n=1 Tax=Melastoma candidum TaxID=119954 RepID=A0ACB9SCC7_9MYRT|nr:hypothetical protein MLD38_001190 [Melastoma candidum]